MSESILIELRQENTNTKVMNNGDYICTMMENVTLKTGDSIVVRNCFVDTTIISNQFITLENDYTIDTQFMYYQYNFQKSGQIYIPEFATETTGPQPGGENTGVSDKGRINGIIHLLVKDKIAPPPNFSDYKTVTFTRNPKSIGSSWGNIPFDVHYTDMEGNHRINHSFLNTQTTGSTVDASILGSGGIIAYDLDIQIVVSNDNLVKGKILSNFTLNKVAVSGEVFHPYYGKISGTIPKGKYTPTELAERVNSIFQVPPLVGNNIYFGGIDGNPHTEALKLLRNSTSYAESGVDEVFIANCNDDVYIDIFGDNGSRNTAANGKNCYITAYSNGGNSGTQRDPVPLPRYWAGASQVDFNYNQDTNKMEINYIHTPQYATSTDKSIQGPEVVTVRTNDHTLDKNNYPVDAGRSVTFFGKAAGGIIFSSMTSSPPGFWDQVMGFDLNSLCIQPNYQKLTPSLNPEEYFIVNPTYFPYMDLVEGKNITAPMIINDMSIQKNGDFNQEFSGGNNLAFDVVGTTQIIAPNVLLDSVLETAYYLIEVDSKFKNNVLTSDNGNMRNVQTICNTYFNSGTYTSASSADSIVYTHQGVDDITLQSFGVRILESNKQLATGIGSDNAVFLQIVKALPAAIPEQVLTKEQKKKEDSKYMT